MELFEWFLYPKLIAKMLTGIVKSNIALWISSLSTVNAKFADGHNVPRINPARNVYSLSYNQDDIVFKLQLKDVEKQNDIGEGETATAGYQMLDTRLTKTFDLSGKSKLKVSLFGRNLLDEVARNHASFVKNEVPLPGRNYGIKFNLTY